MTHRTSSRSILLVMALLLLQTGCTSMQTWLGWKVDLGKETIDSIFITQPKESGIAPGYKSPLVVSFVESHGKTLVTAGEGHGKVSWTDLAVASSVVTVNKHGVVSLPDDPRISEGKTGHVTVTVPSHPDLRADIDIPIRYNHKFTADFSGKNGASGSNGSDGMDGSMGNTGSMDPKNPSPGGNGGNGTSGTDGGNGSAGGSAAPVQAALVLFHDENRLLLQIKVSAGKQEKFFLVDPNGGSLTVKADGGRGGSGGRGGRGGHGGQGGIGTPNGARGMDGFDGHNGFDGAPGKGGLITLTYDPDAKPYLNVIHLSSRNGPKPVLVEAHVDPLW